MSTYEAISFTLFGGALAKHAYGWGHIENTLAFRFEERGEIDVKGKGMMTTFWLEQA